MTRALPRRPSGQVRSTHRVGLILSTIQLVAVVENVLVCGIEAGFYAILHHLAGTGRTLELLDL